MASKGPECSICYEHYNDQSKCPRLLSCGHSFCSRCLERLLRGSTIDCPKCRNPVAVPSGVHGLSKNFALLDIVNETAPKRNTGTTGLHDCEACDENHPEISAALTAKKTCAKLRLSFILATRQVVTTGLLPSRSLKQILSLFLYPLPAKNITINSGFSTRSVVK